MPPARLTGKEGGCCGEQTDNSSPPKHSLSEDGRGHARTMGLQKLHGCLPFGDAEFLVIHSPTPAGYHVAARGVVARRVRLSFDVGIADADRLQSADIFPCSGTRPDPRSGGWASSNGLKYLLAGCGCGCGCEDGRKGNETSWCWGTSACVNFSTILSLTMTIAIPHSAPMPPGLNDVLVGGNVSKSVLINGAKTGLATAEEEEEEEKGKGEDHCLLNGAAIVFHSPNLPNLVLWNSEFTLTLQPGRYLSRHRKISPAPGWGLFSIAILQRMDSWSTTLARVI